MGAGACPLWCTSKGTELPQSLLRVSQTKPVAHINLFFSNAQKSVLVTTWEGSGHGSRRLIKDTHICILLYYLGKKELYRIQDGMRHAPEIHFSLQLL